MQDLTNTIFRGYRLLRCLGRGALSSVYLAEQIDLKLLVAIKILHAQLSKKESERFRNEAHLITRLNHPNIIAAYAYDIEDGVPFIVMKYAPNGSVRQRYPQGVRVPSKDIVRYVTQVASALQYTHDRGRLIHRDVKPENMLLGPDDQVWLSDFGVSLMMSSPDAQPAQEIAGTIRYMALEQIRGKPCFASDQYALGVVVYEWLSGSAPFTGLPAEILFQHLRLPPPSLREKVPTMPPAVEDVVFRALAKAPQARFPSVRAFANALEEAFEQGSRHERDHASLSVIRASASSSWQPGFSNQDELVRQLPEPSVVIQPMDEVEFFSPKNSSRRAEPCTSPLSAPVSPPAPVRVNHMTRRSVIIGLSGLALFVGGGVIAFDLIHANSSSAPTARPARVSPSGTRGSKQTRPTPAAKKQATPAPTPGATLYTYRGHTQAVKSVAWVSNLRVASASMDSTVRIWDATTGGNVLVYSGHKTKVETLAVSPDEAYIASGDGSGKILIWDAITGDDRFMALASEQGSAVRSVTWSPDGHFIAAGEEDSIVSIWEVQTGMRFFAYTGHRGPIRSVAWSPHGKLLASGGVDKTVQVWSATDKKQQALLTYRGHSDIVWDVAWSPDGTRLASASQDGTVQVWNATTGALVARHSIPGGKAESVAWSPSGQLLAGGSDNGTVQVWSVITGQPVLSYHQQKSTIWSLAWSPNGQHLASGNNDDTVSVWQAAG
jgi:WD40 repeat protein/tRNA A-37 threonylcarbamoyl transferase component Bud32